MKSTRILTLAVVLAFPGSILCAPTPGAMEQMDPQKHREMMPIHARMMEEQKAQDDEIATLLAEMNHATGEKRVDAIVAVVNKLVAQRKTMHEKMAALLER